MTQRYILRIDDVGRLNSDCPTSGSDIDLTYFFSWRAASGLNNVPAIYGIVPTWPSAIGRRLFNTQISVDQQAIHGWDHAVGTTTSAQLMLAKGFFPQARAFIPPFNEYDGKLIEHWRGVEGRHFFGGFDKEHHQFGEAPCTIGNMTHWNAVRGLYGTSAQILNNLDTVAETEYPQVITLHVPWETDVSRLRELITKIKPFLVLP